MLLKAPPTRFAAPLIAGPALDVTLLNPSLALLVAFPAASFAFAAVFEAVSLALAVVVEACRRSRAERDEERKWVVRYIVDMSELQRVFIDVGLG